MAKPKTTPQPSPEKKPSEEQTLEQATSKFNNYLRENKIVLVPSMQFPIYNQLPIELELALKIIQKHEPVIDVNLQLQNAIEKPGKVS